MKKLKKLATTLALVSGIALGLGIALVPPSAQAWPGEPECTRDSDCDAICGGPGAGVCHVWKCYCLM